MLVQSMAGLVAGLVVRVFARLSDRVVAGLVTVVVAVGGGWWFAGWVHNFEGHHVCASVQLEGQ